MTFKEQLAADISTFLNPDEFGEEYSVEMGGSEAAAVVGVLEDEEETQPTLSPADGVYLALKRFHCRLSDLPMAPKIGREISVNGDRYQVLDIGRSAGMCVLRLEAYQS